VPVQKLSLGLDLKGSASRPGVRSTRRRLHRAGKRAAAFRRSGLVGTVRREGPMTIVAAPSPESPREKVREEPRSTHLRIEKDDAAEIRLQMTGAEADRIRVFAVDQGLETIRNRIDPFGVAETTVVKQGTNRILVELPGVSDQARARQLIGKTALLEFKLLDEVNSLDDALKGAVPPGSQVLYEQETDPATGQTRRTPYLVQKRVILTGGDLQDAQVDLSGASGKGPAVSMSSPAGAAPCARDRGERRQAPRDRPDDTHWRRSSGEDHRRARPDRALHGRGGPDLAIVLRAGSLPAPVEILEERTVGPSLGSDLVRKGVIATLAATLVVLAFMAVYYALSGLVANLALVINLFLLLAVMAAFGASLTLPGIAGIVLTLGMAVDANVLIFERIREEFRLGKTVRAAIDAGFRRAFTTVIDTHVTVVVSGAILYQFGTGPVKGFAVSLMIGIVASLFTAVFFTRVVFDLIYMGRRRLQTLSI
jgi:preprotein translocase subunit SecD